MLLLDKTVESKSVMYNSIYVTYFTLIELDVEITQDSPNKDSEWVLVIIITCSGKRHKVN